MSEKLLSERDAYELADILNAKGIDKFAEMAENIAHAVGKVEGHNGALFPSMYEACELIGNDERIPQELRDELVIELKERIGALREKVSE